MALPHGDLARPELPRNDALFVRYRSIAPAPPRDSRSFPSSSMRPS